MPRLGGGWVSVVPGGFGLGIGTLFIVEGFNGNVNVVESEPVRECERE